jgi:hypothetical protein
MSSTRKSACSPLPGGFGGGNGTVMLPTGHPVRAGDAIYVLEGFF